MLGTFKELEAISVYIRLYKDYKTIKTKREKKIKKFRKNKKRHGTSRTGDLAGLPAPEALHRGAAAGDK